MAGRNASVNLTGLFANMQRGLMDEGKAGNQFVDTFKRSQAPDLDTNNSNSLMAYSDWARRNGYDEEARQYLALGYRQQEKETLRGQQARLQEGQSGVADMSRKMMAILKNPNLSAEDRETQLNNLQESANAIAKVTPNMEPLKVGNLRTNVEQAFLSQASVEQQMDLAAQQNEREWDRLGNEELRLGMAKEQLAMASETHAEWVNTADYRETLRGLEQEKLAYENSLMLAKRFAGTEGGRDKFNTVTGGAYEGVFNAVEQQRTAQQLQIDEAVQRLEAGSFDYKKEDLVSLGIPDEIAANIVKIGSNLPNAGNTMVVTAIKSVLGGQEAPTSAMLGLFEGAALNWVRNNYDHPGQDTDEKDEAKAKEIALRMANVFMKTSDMEEALKIPSLIGARDAPQDPDDQFADLARQVNEILAAESDAIDPDG